MRGLTPCLVAALVLTACGPSEPAAEVPAAPPVDESAMRGAVRLDDAWTKVTPFVSHQAAMDLLTQCLNKREAELEAGKEPSPLCVDRLKRDAAVVRTIRVETGHAALGDATARLRSLNESAHFIIEKTGSVHQVLDLVYSARRDEVYRQDEVRIVAAGDDGRENGEALARDLGRLFPAAEILHITVTPANQPKGPN